jgi:hypothetical protein
MKFLEALHAGDAMTVEAKTPRGPGVEPVDGLDSSTVSPDVVIRLVGGGGAVYGSFAPCSSP